MTYRYRCGTCRAAARPTATRAESEARRDHHRDTVHGGLVPGGDRVVRVRGAEARDPDVRYVSGRAVLIGLGLLAAATAVSRVLGR
ncbi:hypothetical protein [Streptomyces niveus]|uniref:hypothetical protein n=1 Tax=Streptomyces niveus TaxID=193462 RepID=UPI00344C7773